MRLRFRSTPGALHAARGEHVREVVALEEMDLGARPLRTSVPHLPVVVGLPEPEDPLKAPKDALQAKLVMQLVATHLPHLKESEPVITASTSRSSRT